jgi:hypothetical protein
MSGSRSPAMSKSIGIVATGFFESIGQHRQASKSVPFKSGCPQLQLPQLVGSGASKLASRR